MKTVAIIQARRGSSRLFDKIFMDLMGNPLIFHVIDRLTESSQIDEIVIATTQNTIDDSLEGWANSNNIKCFRGDEDNVLKRYYDAACAYEADIIVRITADDPFKDYRLIDRAVEFLFEKKYDFVCNNSPPTYPEGLDVEALTFDALSKTYKEASNGYQREHVTQYIHQNKDKFQIKNIENDKDLSHHRWTIDEEEDYIFVKRIYMKLYKEKSIFLTDEILKCINEDKSLLGINCNVTRSSQYKKIE